MIPSPQATVSLALCFLPWASPLAQAKPLSARAGVSTACGTIPASFAPYNISGLPDPFTTIGGKPVKTLEGWQCRRQEISALFQNYELGYKPPKPPVLTASFISVNGTNSLSIGASMPGAANITFAPRITYPASGKAPYPAIISLGGLSLPQPAGVAIIAFNNDEIAAQTSVNSRGMGKFFDLYGRNANHTQGAMIAWAWGVSRILDALEMTPSANIDATKVGVTGCSRNGKGAIIAGAFDDRIALTIPQESGTGGSACFRISDYLRRRGLDSQTSAEIVTENAWFSTDFDYFAGGNIAQLPVDHHELAALIAPRGLLVTEPSDIDWLAPESTYDCMMAGRRVYEALGHRDHIGYSAVGSHPHCRFPTEQQGSILQAFVDKFLFDRQANTDVFETDFGVGNWVNWQAPKLSGSG